MFLQLINVPDRYAYLDKTLQLSAILSSKPNDDGRVVLGKRVYFHIRLYYSDEPEVFIENGIDIINSDEQYISEVTGMSKQLHVQFKVHSTSYRKFVLAALPIDCPVIPYRSLPISIIRYQIKIMNKQNIPSEWYKDRGGKYNFIDIKVQVADSSGQSISEREDLKLNCTAHILDSESSSTTSSMENGKTVSRNCLQISSDTNPYVDVNGETTFRIRFNQLSKNYDHCPFVVRISPVVESYNTDNYDIGDDFTDGIEVKSKATYSKKRDRDIMSMSPSQTEVIDNKRVKTDVNVEKDEVAEENQFLERNALSTCLQNADASDREFDNFAIEVLHMWKQRLTSSPNKAKARKTLISAIDSVTTIHESFQEVQPPVISRSESFSRVALPLTQQIDSMDCVFEYGQECLNRENINQSTTKQDGGDSANEVGPPLTGTTTTSLSFSVLAQLSF